VVQPRLYVPRLYASWASAGAGQELGRISSGSRLDRLHLGCIPAVSRLYLGLHLGCISGCISNLGGGSVATHSSGAGQRRSHKSLRPVASLSLRWP